MIKSKNNKNSYNLRFNIEIKCDIIKQKIEIYRYNDRPLQKVQKVGRSLFSDQF